MTAIHTISKIEELRSSFMNAQFARWNTSLQKFEGAIVDLSAYVPYTGASSAVVLGANTLSTTAGLISPKWYPTADSTTAIQINKADGTTNVLTVDTTNGRVGIGTTSPTSTLTVAKTSAGATADLIRLENASTNANTGVGITVFNTTTDLTTDDVVGRILFQRQANDSQKLLFQLYNGADAALETVLTFDPYGNGSVTFGAPMVVNSPTANAAELNFAGATYIKFIDNAAGVNNARIGAVADNLIFETGTTERVRILSSNGNVGIGTTTPGKTLDVYSNTNGEISSRVYNPNGGTGAYAQFTVQNGTSDGIGGIQVLGGGWTDSGFNLHNQVNLYASTGVTNGFGIMAQANAPIKFGTNNTEQMRITSTGNVGIRQTSPTAAIHLPAGTATAGTAPLKFTVGVNLTTPEAGAMEFDGTNLFITQADGTRKTLAFV